MCLLRAIGLSLSICFPRVQPCVHTEPQLALSVAPLPLRSPPGSLPLHGSGTFPTLLPPVAEPIIDSLSFLPSFSPELLWLPVCFPPRSLRTVAPLPLCKCPPRSGHSQTPGPQPVGCKVREQTRGLGWWAQVARKAQKQQGNGPALNRVHLCRKAIPSPVASVSPHARSVLFPPRRPSLSPDWSSAVLFSPAVHMLGSGHAQGLDHSFSRAQDPRPSSSSSPRSPIAAPCHGLPGNACEVELRLSPLYPPKHNPFLRLFSGNVPSPSDPRAALVVSCLKVCDSPSQPSTQTPVPQNSSAITSGVPPDFSSCLIADTGVSSLFLRKSFSFLITQVWSSIFWS
ncbi:uncharacterized protein LOC125085293 [Lutra lutra]|uniref:uncharacterized protein LOC125085293 n=1 Tax=Lutra lutra TaxID=9657 RepID=UPI001FD4D8A4|nr:uncharacterized protein LOC125085293 [Lutra lutra]